MADYGTVVLVDDLESVVIGYGIAPGIAYGGTIVTVSDKESTITSYGLAGTVAPTPPPALVQLTTGQLWPRSYGGGVVPAPDDITETVDQSFGQDVGGAPSDTVPAPAGVTDGTPTVTLT